MMKNLGRVGRGLWVATAALAAYNVLESDDKLKTAGKEGAKIGGGVLGGMTGGAVAGWICGPGAPFCSGVGILVGGVAGAMGVDVGLDFLSGMFEDDKK